VANTKSAKKRIRQTKKRTLINERYRQGIKTLKKQIRKAVEKKEAVEKVKELLSEFYSIVDKAAKRHVIHKNKAARLKSRVTKAVEKALSA
jgi:small subunit ribosomal protein S20